MITVQKGKRLYVGARRFVEGDIIPPGLRCEFIEDVIKPEIKIEDKPKRQYRTRRSVQSVIETQPEEVEE